MSRWGTPLLVIVFAGGAVAAVRLGDNALAMGDIFDRGQARPPVGRRPERVARGLAPPAVIFSLGIAGLFVVPH